MGELRELIYEWGKNTNNIFSNLMGDIKSTIDSHTVEIAQIHTEMKEGFKRMDDQFDAINVILDKHEEKINSLNETRASQSGGKNALGWAFNAMISAISAFAAVYLLKK